MIYQILTGAMDEYWDSTRETNVRTPPPILGAGTTLSEVM